VTRRLAPLLALAAAALAAAPATASEPAPTAVPAPSDPSITLTWSARNEGTVYGYLIYRAERRQGPFLRINHDIVRVDETATDETVSRYRWVDTTVTPGATYYYYLDTVSLQGRKSRFSGVLKKTAPQGASDGAAP
jgi:hypothetical protein